MKKLFENWNEFVNEEADPRKVDPKVFPQKLSQVKPKGARFMSKTGQADGSVRMYYDMQVTNTTNSKSVIIPIYESFDFNEEGKAVFVQWYSDWTASIESIE